ncbi:copper amine oxidase N-terminal domain-containing protein [Cohnella sp.]|uniref:copper amine oxidase N-terminal domain-containing protein n=1 Tax=Cohnella sp. TaxID=1883426 RepID=UPI00356A6C0C
MELKRIMIIVLSLVLALSLAGTAAAATKPQSIKLVLDGKVVELSSSIEISKGKTFVEFRALLEKLGYKIEYDKVTKTIHAKADGITIEMSVGSDVAFVNGKTVPSTGEVIAKNGKTMVGLRFAGVISNYKVGWNDKTQTITLTYLGPAPEQKAAVNELFNKLLLVEASGDLEGLADLFSEDTVMDVDTLKEQWAEVKTKTTIHEIIIESFSDKEVIVVTNDETVKLSGGFFPDNAAQTRYTLHVDSDGSLKIYDMEPLDIVFTNVQELFDEAAAIPEADKTAIDKVFAEQLKAASEENLDNYLATIVDFEEKEAMIDTIKQLFATTTIKTTLEKMTIVKYSAEDNSATLLLSMVSEVEQSNGMKVKVRAIILNGAEKTNGKWLLSPEARILFSEQL